jgi:hypothetical protein
MSIYLHMAILPYGDIIIKPQSAPNPRATLKV